MKSAGDPNIFPSTTHIRPEDAPVSGALPPPDPYVWGGQTQRRTHYRGEAGSVSWACYLARPLDQASIDVKSLVKDLEEAGALVYDPGSWSRAPDGHPFPQQVHNAALANADAMLAILPDATPTIGVPIELERFAASGKPVVVLGGDVVARSPVLAARHIPVSLVPHRAVIALEVLVNEYRTDRGIPSRSFAFLDVVAEEIRRAQVKHPRSNELSVEEWFGVWMEEVFEAVQAWNDSGSTKPGSREDVKIELVQVAAMAARLWGSL